MLLTVEECLAAIDLHTRGLAAAAETDLEARIEHCPGWSMADLVWHVIGVHRFWNGVATDLPVDEPAEVSEDDRPADDQLTTELVRGMETLVATLRSADQDAACWTWGLDQDVRFITRHQVQEAAVHHWDAVNAGTGADRWTIDPEVARDAVDEILTHSLPNRRWPSADTGGLGGTVWFRCTGTGTGAPDAWHVVDGEVPGTLAHRSYRAGEEPVVLGPAVGAEVDPATLLLWLYERVGEPGPWQGESAVLDRFLAIAG